MDAGKYCREAFATDARRIGRNAPDTRDRDYADERQAASCRDMRKWYKGSWQRNDPDIRAEKESIFKVMRRINTIDAKICKRPKEKGVIRTLSRKLNF